MVDKLILPRSQGQGNPELTTELQKYLREKGIERPYKGKLEFLEMVNFFGLFLFQNLS